MSFITISDVEQVLTSTRLDKLSDFNPDNNPPERDEAHITACIERAERKVEAKLRKRYKLNAIGGNIPDPINDWMLQQTCWELYAARPQYRGMGLVYKNKVEEYEQMAESGDFGPDFIINGETALAHRDLTPVVAGPEKVIGKITDREYF